MSLSNFVCLNISTFFNNYTFICRDFLCNYPNSCLLQMCCMWERVKEQDQTRLTTSGNGIIIIRLWYSCFLRNRCRIDFSGQKYRIVTSFPCKSFYCGKQLIKKILGKEDLLLISHDGSLFHNVSQSHVNKLTLPFLNYHPQDQVYFCKSKNSQVTKMTWL